MSRASSKPCLGRLKPDTAKDSWARRPCDGDAASNATLVAAWDALGDSEALTTPNVPRECDLGGLVTVERSSPPRAGERNVRRGVRADSACVASAAPLSSSHSAAAKSLSSSGTSSGQADASAAELLALPAAVAGFEPALLAAAAAAAARDRRDVRPPTTVLPCAAEARDAAPAACAAVGPERCAGATSGARARGYAVTYEDSSRAVEGATAASVRAAVAMAACTVRSTEADATSTINVCRAGSTRRLRLPAAPGTRMCAGDRWP